MIYRDLQLLLLFGIALALIWAPNQAYADINTNLIPDMTSATTPSGIVSASGELNSSYAGWYAFAYSIPNGNSMTWAISGNSGWLQYQFPTPHMVTKYAITNRNESSPRSPKNWTFQGSNNGSTWTVLDTQTDITSWTSAPNTTLTFTFTNTNSYTYYRISVTNTDSYIGI